MMSRYTKIASLALLALLGFAPFASARPPAVAFRGHFGPRFYRPGIVVGPRFVYGPGWYYPGWYGAGFYGLGWYEPYGYVASDTAGKIKIDTKAKDAEVYVDGGYAGTVKQLGTFPLKAGTHDIELRDPNGQSFYQEHIDVIAGKTIKLAP